MACGHFTYTGYPYPHQCETKESWQITNPDGTEWMSCDDHVAYFCDFTGKPNTVTFIDEVSITQDTTE